MIYRFHDCELDVQLYQLRRSGEIVPLEPQVFRLLAYLLAHCDRAVSREELFEKLWPGQVVGDAALTYCVAKARKAVQDTGGQQRVIKTVHGHGYRLIAQVFTASSLFDTRLRTADQAASEQRPLAAFNPYGNEQSESFSMKPAQVNLAQPIQPTPRPSWQHRQFTIIACLFILGWATALWQASTRSLWLLSPLRTASYQTTSNTTPTTGKLCGWWVLSTPHQAAVEVLLRGWGLYNRSTPEAVTQTRWLFQRAIDIDPTYAAAYASLGWVAWQDWLSWSQDPNSLEQASLYLQKAVALDSSCPQALTLLANVRFTQRRQAQAIAEAERALTPTPLPSPSMLSRAPSSRLRVISSSEGSRVPSDAVR